MKSGITDRLFLKKYAWLSVGGAVFTIVFKTAAYLMTNSVGLLSDAMESIVNLIGAFMALAMLNIAAKPADDDHAYGHSKAEYFSAGVEGSLIVVAAIGIGIFAVLRLITPEPLDKIGLGLSVSVVASFVNLVIAIILFKAGKRHDSITLEANAKHLMADVWTSAGVLVGVGAVALSGWQQLDPVIAIIVAVNIVWTGVKILRQSVLGLMDTAISPEELSTLKSILDSYAKDNIQFHALRSRQAGSRRFVSFHVIVPGEWTVNHGHHFLEELEGDIRKKMPNVNVFTHLESLNDPASWDDVDLDREVI